MKFIILKKAHIKSINLFILLTILIILFILGILLLQNKKYEIKEMSNLLKDEFIAIRVMNEENIYEKSKKIPINGYILNKEESYCEIKQNDNTYTKEEVNITYKSGKVTIDKINRNGMRCFLYFDKACDKACKAILANNIIDNSRSSGEFISTFEEETTGKIFKGPADDYGETTYFFAGANPNNWFKFAGFYWRIMRVNGDGTIRLIYNGTTTDQTGAGTQIGTGPFNEAIKDNAYIGYMYGTPGSSTYRDTHANMNDSAIKKAIDEWYETNLLNTEYEKHIDINTGFCGDRKVVTGLFWGQNITGDGANTNTTMYAPLARTQSGEGPWKTKQTATYECSQDNDLYTNVNSNKGNKTLKYSIGLITSDDIIYSGGFAGSNNTSYWLYTNQVYWTMSPTNISHEGNFTRVFRMSASGYLGDGAYEVNWTTPGYRPVINLKANTTLTGIGTATDPYVVV